MIVIVVITAEGIPTLTTSIYTLPLATAIPRRTLDTGEFALTAAGQFTPAQLGEPRTIQ